MFASVTGIDAGTGDDGMGEPACVTTVLLLETGGTVFVIAGAPSPEGCVECSTGGAVDVVTAELRSIAFFKGPLTLVQVT